MLFLQNYGYFLLATLTIVAGILTVVAGVITLIGQARGKERGQWVIKNLSKEWDKIQDLLHQKILSKSQAKQQKKIAKAHLRADKKSQKPCLFYLKFEGDMRAFNVENLKEAINAIILIAKPHDQVLVHIESPGGLVSGYGLGASQLQRLKNAKLKLIVGIDKIAASGGYMMACVADHILCAPFAIIGSIGVVAAIPNFHRWLKNKQIDFEQLTAGEFKRTLTWFGKNTEEGRKKMQQEIDETHELFKTHVSHYRPKVDLNKIATGEHWYGHQAINLNLVDEIKTVDDYLLTQKDHYRLYSIEYKLKRSLNQRFMLAKEAIFSSI